MNTYDFIIFAENNSQLFFPSKSTLFYLPITILDFSLDKK